jgi:hypothetical protein
MMVVVIWRDLLVCIVYDCVRSAASSFCRVLVLFRTTMSHATEQSNRHMTSRRYLYSTVGLTSPVPVEVPSTSYQSEYKNRLSQKISYKYNNDGKGCVNRTVFAMMEPEFKWGGRRFLCSGLSANLA